MDIQDLNKAQLAEWFLQRGEPPYRAVQVLRWIYRRGAMDFAHMTDLPAELRRHLTAAFTVSRLHLLRRSRSEDGTEKYLLALGDGQSVESVLIPDRLGREIGGAAHSHGAGRRLTLCISSQVGCGMGCRFCATARVGMVRNMTAAEIINQALAVQRFLPAGERLTHIVFMGMGEPLANYTNVVRAIALLTAEWGMGLSPRRITVSTVGLIPNMRRLLEETRVNLAVSLVATTDEIREKLVPVNRRFPLGELLHACRALPLSPRKRITFEYVMLKGVNDGEEDARRLARLLHGLRCKVNLIPFNPFPGHGFSPSPRPQIETFRQILLDRGMTATVRESRGQDIQAACGQLVAEYQSDEDVCGKTQGEDLVGGDLRYG